MATTHAVPRLPGLLRALPWLIALAVVVAPVGVSAEASGQRATTRTFESLPRQTAAHASANADAPATAWRIRWDVHPGAGSDLVEASRPSTAPRFTVVDRRPAVGAARERHPELSETHLVAVGVNAAGDDACWQLVADPRVVRAEFPDASGRLQGSTFHRAVTELVVTVPDAAGVVAIELFAPRWTEAGWVLDRVAAFSLDGGR